VKNLVFEIFPVGVLCDAEFPVGKTYHSVCCSKRTSVWTHLAIPKP